MGRGSSGAGKGSARYMNQLGKLDSADGINELIERAANDDSLTNAEYQRIYSAAISRAQEAAQQEAEQRRSSAPTSGTKTQRDYIAFVQHQTGINLEPARDTQFDTRKYFNIDTRSISTSDLAIVRRLAQTTPGDFEVSFQANGSNRLAVFVKKRR